MESDPWSNGHTTPDSPVSTSMRDLLSCECHFGTGQLKSTGSSAGGTMQLVPVCRSKPKASRAAAGQRPLPCIGRKSVTTRVGAGDPGSRHLLGGSIRPAVLERASPVVRAVCRREG